MRLIEKTLDVTFKALEDEEPGTFEAVVACFGNVDRHGEVVEKGAFAESLANSQSFPVVWSHQWIKPPVGVSLLAVEVDEGLKVKGRLFVREDEDSQLAREIWTAMKAGALKEWSFGAGVKSERYEDRNGQKVTVLETLDLVEFGPTLKGANTETRTVAIKNAEREAFERLQDSADTASDSADDTDVAEKSQESVTEPQGNNQTTIEDRRAIARLLF